MFNLSLGCLLVFPNGELFNNEKGVQLIKVFKLAGSINQYFTKLEVVINQMFNKISRLLKSCLLIFQIHKAMLLIIFK